MHLQDMQLANPTAAAAAAAAAAKEGGSASSANTSYPSCDQLSAAFESYPRGAKLLSHLYDCALQEEDQVT